ncbi:hypothetical protein B0H11DRAFT_1078154 [Mycena galericulata]|nr:hypothetical protein B0H11DRAFT_1078154 [Mycena galericulata]
MKLTLSRSRTLFTIIKISSVPTFRSGSRRKAKRSLPSQWGNFIATLASHNICLLVTFALTLSSPSVSSLLRSSSRCRPVLPCPEKGPSATQLLPKKDVMPLFKVTVPSCRADCAPGGGDAVRAGLGDGPDEGAAEDDEAPREWTLCPSGR